jgi:hypothetical protein
MNTVNPRFTHIAAPTADELFAARYMAADQFMGHCWSLAYDYEEYAFHAARLEYKVYGDEDYKAYCQNQDDQMAAYYADSGAAIAEAEAMSFNMRTYGTIDVPK